MWQDVIFAAGAMVSLTTLLPTLLSRDAAVPLTTSVVAALLGVIYAVTFLSLGMGVSAVGAIVISTVWFGIAVYRQPKEVCHA